MTWRILAVALLSGTVVSADEAGDALRDKVIEAYRGLNDYRSTVTFEAVQQDGRWHRVQSAELYVALDRDSGRLAFDKPDLRMVIDGGQLQATSPQLTGSHLAMTAPAMELEAITSAVPVLGQPLPPDLAFLTAGDPLLALGAKAQATAAGDEAKPVLRFPVENGDMALQLNPTTHLIETATLTFDTVAMGGGGNDTMTLTYRIDAKAGEAAGDDAFALDTTGSTGAATVQAWIAAGQGGGAGGAPAQAGMEGQDAPEIELTMLDGQAFKLSEVKAKVVVLDFWATWCPPCREGLPKLQAVHDWAKAQGKDVAVYTVNLQELPEQARAFMQKAKLNMPVVMDADGKAGEAYQVQSIPQTFVISGGKVRHVHVGFDPKMDETLKAEIEALLTAE